ncbi:MAG: hypothetical protein EZS28_052574, partial [Streblomastix strix]
VISPNKGSKISLLPPAPKTRPVIVSHSSSSSINQQSHEQQSQRGSRPGSASRSGSSERQLHGSIGEGLSEDAQTNLKKFWDIVEKVK